MRTCDRPEVCRFLASAEYERTTQQTGSKLSDIGFAQPRGIESRSVPSTVGLFCFESMSGTRRRLPSPSAHAQQPRGAVALVAEQASVPVLGSLPDGRSASVRRRAIGSGVAPASAEEEQRG
jgi:hypothetical protein